jgi:hypothetical protein
MNGIAAATITSVPVSVVNTPLPVQGTVTANIDGMPTVNANINGTPTVNANINGTPAVTLNTTPTTPVYVDADRPARNSFDASCNTGNVDPVYGQASCTIFTIPAGRQVVIETAACTAELAAGTGPGQADLIIPNIPYGAAPGSGPIGYYYTLAMSKQADGAAVGASVDLWGMTTQFRAYGAAPAAGTVDIGVFFRANLSSAPQGMNCTISGYVVP